VYLKALTIRGFKSFARKTVLEFEPGVTIIVGPNGSGKSNIADAVMWVLGEQSPTSLRGNRMEDVIFSGSANVRPVNIAEVELVLDNANSDFPLEYSEVTIARNVVRGGDSEYRLNSSACRLLDIQEMLSDAGVGRTLNAVISQGQLDDVLLCRPEERRDYLEEAGGLLKYRRRREKALRRLTRMDEELLRINDVLREVRRQLRPLVRQAGRLEQYQGLSRQLSEERLRLDVNRLRTMQREWKAHEEAQSERAEQLAGLDGKLAELQAEVSAIEAGEEGWRDAETALRETLYRLVSAHEQLKALMPVWEEKKRVIEARSERSVDPAELAELERKNASLEAARTELQKRHSSAREIEAGHRDKADRLGGRLEAVTREAIALEAQLEVLEAAGGGGVIEDRAERRRGHEEQLVSLEAEQAGLGEALDASEEELAAVRHQRLEYEGELGKNSRRRDEVANRVKGFEADQAQLLTRLDILSRLDAGRWDALSSAGALMRNDPTGGGLGGMLVNNLRIERAYETAIMGFLGPWAFSLQARDANAVLSAVRHLKQRRLGQSLFFLHSQDGVHKATVEDVEAPADPAGAVRARDVVEAPGPFSEALDILLKGVYIAPDIDAAFSLAREYTRLVFLSPEGDVVSGGTFVKGGSTDVSPVHLEMTLSRREELERELDECRRGLESAELELSANTAREEELRLRLEALKSEEESLNSTLRDGTAGFSALTALMSSLVEELGRCEVTTEFESMDLTREMERLDGLRGTREALSGELAEARGLLEAAEEERKRIEYDIQSAERELLVGRGREEKLRQLLESGAETRTVAHAEDLRTLEQLKVIHGRLLERVRAARERARVEIESGSARRYGASSGMRSLRERISASQRLHEELREQMHAEDLSRAELKIKVEQLVDRITDEHKVPLEFALAHYPDEPVPVEELERRVDELALRMERIGPVNPEAIAERQALEERHDFLKGQLDDIEKSKTQLKRVVREIDREIIDKFNQTVDEVNGHFKDIFSFLFPNGNAEVRLTDPEDPLGCGVEILAQPEGKRLRRISLLSGGETSLTAIAFFFALFRVRPSPFYFLDEVEAALDDVNLHRFLDLVKQFKGESQLVLITHQKRSMEIADILYGVSMQEDGISRVVSQRVAERIAS
jgi:chromosome segregation protein